MLSGFPFYICKVNEEVVFTLWIEHNNVCFNSKFPLFAFIIQRVIGFRDTIHLSNSVSGRASNIHPIANHPQHDFNNLSSMHYHKHSPRLKCGTLPNAYEWRARDAFPPSKISSEFFHKNSIFNGKRRFLLGI